MTKLESTSVPQVESYLASLNKELGDMPAVEREEILREIRTHILESAGPECNEAELARVLSSLGTPAKLAQTYRAEILIGRTSHSYFPWILLRTALEWAKAGMTGLAVFLIGLIGYGSAVALTISAILKPFMPSRIGLWSGPHTLSFGTTSDPSTARELLGHWYSPVVALLAFGIGVATTEALRWLMRNNHSLVNIRSRRNHAGGATRI